MINIVRHGVIFLKHLIVSPNMEAALQSLFRANLIWFINAVRKRKVQELLAGVLAGDNSCFVKGPHTNNKVGADAVQMGTKTCPNAPQSM